MGKLLQIAQLGNPILRQKAKLVEDVRDDSIQALIDSLIATLEDANGVGIAAPQVYESYRIFVVHSYPNPRYPNAPEIGPIVVINPEIVSHSDEKTKDWEGCLSIPGIRALVPRYRSITIRYTTGDGGVEEVEFQDFVARIFQHENDHLDGVVFLDRLESNKDIITEKEYQKIITRK